MLESASRGGLLWGGVPAPGGGVPAPGGRVCLLRGDAWSGGGCLLWGVVPSLGGFGIPACIEAEPPL